MRKLYKQAGKSLLKLREMFYKNLLEIWENSRKILIIFEIIFDKLKNIEGLAAVHLKLTWQKWIF